MQCLNKSNPKNYQTQNTKEIKKDKKCNNNNN